MKWFTVILSFHVLEELVDSYYLKVCHNYNWNLNIQIVLMLSTAYTALLFLLDICDYFNTY